MFDLSRSRMTNEVLLKDVLLAKRINQVMGGVLVGPWDIRDLPDDTIDSILSLEQLGSYQAGRQKVESVLDHWRNSHPNYRRKQ